MPDTDIGSTIASDVTSAITKYTVNSEVTESGDGSVEFRYQNSFWSEDFGYYSIIPEFKTAIDTKAIWTLGAGFESDEITTMLLSNVKGNGKDSFNSILKNMIKVKTITGDSFAEVIRDGDGALVNLKPLDPSSVVIVFDKKGRIKRYEQVHKGKVLTTFKPTEMFHLSHDRMADSVHGTRIVQSLKWLIEARNEAMSDWRVVLRRNVRPMRIWYLDTDDEDKIAEQKRKTDAAYGNTENIYVPKGTVETEIATVAPNQTLNPVTWIDMLNDYFYQSVMAPQILHGNAKGFTDASGKIVYLAYEQFVKTEQLYVEEQVLNQLDVEIALTFPASLQNDLISEKDKDPVSGAVEPNDQQVEMEGKK